jgi:hypothetical protein
VIDVAPEEGAVDREVLDPPLLPEALEYTEVGALVARTPEVEVL